MVSEKKLKQTISLNKKLITDEAFFKSSIVRNYFIEIANLLVHRVDTKAKIGARFYWEPKDSTVAYTDNRTITINCANSLATAHKTRADRLDIIKGLFAHELAHILYTDFTLMEVRIDAVSVGRWFPNEPNIAIPDLKARLDDISEFCKDKNNRKKFISILHHIDNIIEDGFIEEAFMDHFKGNLAGGLYFLRDTHWDEIEPVWKLVEYENLDPSDPKYRHPFTNIMQELLCYAKYGEFKTESDDELDEDCVKALIPCIPYIDKALSTYDTKKRAHNINNVIVLLWPQIKDYLESIPESSSGSSGDPRMSGSVSKTLSESTTGSSSSGSGSGTSGKPVDKKHKAGSSDSEKSEAAKKREETAKKTGASSGSDHEEDSDSSDSKSKKSEEEKGSGTGSSGSDDGEDESSLSDAEDASGFSSSREGSKRKVTSSEGGRISEHETSEIYTGEDGAGSIEKEEIEPDEDYSGSAAEVESLLTKIATEKSTDDLETEIRKALNDETKAMSMGSAHSGISCKIRRITSVNSSMVESYKEIAPPLEQIAKRLAKAVRQKLKDKKRGGKDTNLLFGRRMEARALIRDDGRCFYKNRLPNQNPEIAVAICVDESGSMCCGNRAVAARAAAIVLYNFCCELDIPVMVYGHTADEGHWGTVQLQSYAEFGGSYDKNDKYRLMDISARSNNRDGFALNYMYQKLYKRPEDTKILFIISDGQPAASGYSGSAAEADMKAIRQEAKRKGVITFAAAIGNDRENIERIYKEGFLDISNLDDLPIILTKLLLKYIKT